MEPGNNQASIERCYPLQNEATQRSRERKRAFLAAMILFSSSAFGQKAVANAGRQDKADKGGL